MGQQGECVELREEIGVDPCWELHVELEGIGSLVCSLLYALILLPPTLWPLSGLHRECTPVHKLGKIP